MRYALVSDIHANWQAWQAVLKDIEKAGVDGVICLGDIVGYGPQPAKVLESVYEASDLFILGNHDAVICGRFDSECFNDEAKVIIDWTGQQLNNSAEDFFNQVPMMVIADEFACSHAEFAIPERFDYIYDPPEATESFEATEQPLLFVGHTHYPGTIRKGSDGRLDYFKPQDFNLQNDSRYLVNVGSVGDPRNGDIRASYCIYDLEKNTVEFRNVPFDIEEFRHQIRQAGIPTKPILFDYADHIIDVEAQPETARIRNFHVDEELAKAAAGKVNIERISDSNLQTRDKITVSAGSTGDGTSFRSAHATQARAAREAQRRQKKIMLAAFAATLLLAIVVGAGYILTQKNDLLTGTQKSTPIRPENTTAELSTNQADVVHIENVADSTTDPLPVPSHPPITKPLILVTESSLVKAVVPTEQNGGETLGEVWRTSIDEELFTTWKSGINGVGYETRPDAAENYSKYIKVDVLEQMSNKHTSCYIRIPFSVVGIGSLEQLPRMRLSMIYDDGFIAYINGVRIADANAPAQPTWNDHATKGHHDSEALTWQHFDVTEHISALKLNDINILAIHGLNDKKTSSDFLILPTLKAMPPPPPAEVVAARKQAAKAAEAEEAKELADLKKKLRQRATAKKHEGKYIESANIYTSYQGKFGAETKDWREKEASTIRNELTKKANDLRNKLTTQLLNEEYEDLFRQLDSESAKITDLASNEAFATFAKEITKVREAHQRILRSFEAQKSQELQLSINNELHKVRVMGVEKGQLILLPTSGRRKPTPTPLRQIKAETRIERLRGDQSSGAQILNAIMIAHTGQKGAPDKVRLAFDRSRMKLGGSLKSEYDKLLEKKRDDWARSAIKALKTRAGIPLGTRDAKGMKLAIYKKLPVTRATIDQLQNEATQIAMNIKGHKAHADNKALFDLVPKLTPLGRINPSPKDLGLYYNMQERTKDKQSAKLRGSAPAHPLLKITGQERYNPTEFGKVLSFNGSNTYLHTPNRTPISKQGKAFTITFWAKTKATNRNTYYFTLGKRNEPYHALKIGFNRDRVRHIEVSPNIAHSNGPPLELETWHLHVIRYQTGLFEWYISGQPPISVKIDQSLDLQPGLYLGAGIDQNNKANDLFKGYLTEFQIYDRAFTHNELNRLLAPFQ